MITCLAIILHYRRVVKKKIYSAVVEYNILVLLYYSNTSSQKKIVYPTSTHNVYGADRGHPFVLPLFGHSLFFRRPLWLCTQNLPRTVARCYFFPGSLLLKSSVINSRHAQYLHMVLSQTQYRNLNMQQYAMPQITCRKL